MKKYPAIIAIVIAAVGLAVNAPYSQAAGPTDQIPGQSQAQKDREAARMHGVTSRPSTVVRPTHDFATKKTTR